MSTRRAVLLTARREIRERLRSRAFLASTAIQVAIVIAIVVVGGITGDDDGEDFKVATVGERAAAVAEVARKQQAAFGVSFP